MCNFMTIFLDKNFRCNIYLICIVILNLQINCFLLTTKIKAWNAITTVCDIDLLILIF